MCLFDRKLKKGKRLLCACLFVCMVFVVSIDLCDAVSAPVSAYATEATESVTLEETAISETETQVDESAATQQEEPPFTAKEKFVVFVCCLFSVAVCLIIGLYGNPNDRLKDKYKRAKKQQQLQEKKKKEAELRAIRRAEEDAKYAKELEQYEADLKAYEEEKAAKAAAKAAKKAEKEAKKK